MLYFLLLGWLKAVFERLLIKPFLEMIKTDAVFYCETSCLGTAEGGKVGATIESPADITGEGALNNYLHLSPKQPANTFSNQLDLSTYSRGMGGLGLPGDLSSASRFARVAFVKQNSISGNSDPVVCRVPGHF